jgi:hypothetical protein
VYIEGDQPAFDGNTDGASSGKLLIDSGVTNAIADNATLTLTGDGGLPGSVAGCDRGCAILGSGINEIVGGLMLGGVTEPAGTYGATGSGATNIFDEYFSGSGIVTVVPAGIPGDYNNNGVVDAADYVLWRKNPGAYGGDPAGYTTWRTNFGTHSGSGSGLGTSAVPEPATIALAGLIASVLVVPRRRRFSKIE